MRVLRKIDFNGTKVNQYFHEIVCRRNAVPSATGESFETRVTGKSYSECHGIDKSVSNGPCILARPSCFHQSGQQVYLSAWVFVLCLCLIGEKVMKGVHCD